MFTIKMGFDNTENCNKCDFKILPNGYKINIEFEDLSYVVPDRKEGSKSVLKNVSGKFHSGQLTAIMGTSGSGKTTLINVLAGYRTIKTSGAININKKPQDMKLFRRMSRYILQHDNISPYFTVKESMMYAAKLKLDSHLSKQEHIEKINKILEILQLRNQVNTNVAKLSGGQKKRLCIALELLDISPVLFLDEPTSGLDEFSAAQCMQLLKRLVVSGRTIICSIHAPSARLFELIDQVYVLDQGHCVYQGSTTNILPYLRKFGLICPITYNPADFIIEVVAGEYGNYHDEMVNEVKNGKVYKWHPIIDIESEQNQMINLPYINPKIIEEFQVERNSNAFLRSNSWLKEYSILYMQMMKQMWRDKSYIKLKVFIQVFTVFLISMVYIGIGTNAPKLMYNYHFLSIVSITFIFISMCPMLSRIPLEMNYLRREYFNQWYRLSSYFFALITTQLPDVFVLGVVCSALLYFLTDQPPEFYRFSLFLFALLVTALTASSYGMALSSRFNLLNSLFLGPYIVACWVILANITVNNPNRPTFMQFIMYTSYSRHSVESLMAALFEFNRPDAICPPEEIFCFFKKSEIILKVMGFENLNYTHSMLYLFGFYVLFTFVAYFNFKCRLDSLPFFVSNRYYQCLRKCTWK